MADQVLSPKEFSHEHMHGMFVHTDPATLVVNAAQVTIDGAGGSAFIPFTSPAPVSIKVTDGEDWISFQITDKGVELFIAPATSALDDAKREATVTLQSGTTSIDVPVMQTWPQDRGFSLMTDSVIEIEAAGDTKNVILQTDQSWTVDCGESWITYDKTYGNGSAQIAVTIAESKESVTRYGFVKISAGNQKLYVEFRQKPAED